MMKTNLKDCLLTLLMAAIIAVTSVMQFHHHCCDGEIRIHLTALDDMVIGGERVLEECHHDNVNTHHQSAHHHDQDNCSMHLSDFRGCDDDNGGFVMQFTAECELHDLTVNIAEAGRIIEIIETRYITPQTEIITMSRGLRAPPAMVLC